jgi:hypothetical protein
MQVKIVDSSKDPNTQQWSYQIEDMDGNLVDNGQFVDQDALSNNED